MLRLNVVVAPDIDLSRLTAAEKDALILALLSRIDALERQVAALSRPAKTPDNSSTPPAHGRKPNRPVPGKGGRKGRAGIGRELHPEPDRVVETFLAACPHCQGGLVINEGAFSNILARARAPLTAATELIAAAVTASRVVCSDETSARVTGRNWWEWVFATSAGVLHLIRPSRGAAVPRDLFGAVRPAVWVSDALPSQRGHAEDWQMCLAHLLRDAQYAIDCGDKAFSAPLRRRIARDRSSLFVFVTDRDVPATNNVSERALRPSVVFRKVTSGFRAEWGAETYAACCFVVTTAKLNGNPVLGAIREALSGQPVSVGGRAVTRNVGLALSCLVLPLKIRTLTKIEGPDRNILANSYQILIVTER